MSREVESSAVNGAGSMTRLSISVGLAGALLFAPYLNPLLSMVSFNSLTSFVHIAEVSTPGNLRSISSHINS